jgi:DNA-binding NarL/FixJ family response regulator
MIRLLLVNEVQIISNVIMAALADAPEITVAGSAATVDEALAEIVKNDIDIVLISTRLPENGTLKLTHRLVKSDPEIKVLVLGLNEIKEQVLPYIEAGAAGYILKDDSVDQMIACIRSAYEDQAIISPHMAAVLMSRVVELARLLSELHPGGYTPVDLTARELEVLALLEHGLNNQEIADRLVIEVGTVKNHVHNILEKLEVNNRADAALYGVWLRENGGAALLGNADSLPYARTDEELIPEPTQTFSAVPVWANDGFGA